MLQCVAVCCSVMQCVAVCCSVLQCVSSPLTTCMRAYIYIYMCMYVCVYACSCSCVHDTRTANRAQHVTQLQRRVIKRIKLHTKVNRFQRRCLYLYTKKETKIRFHFLKLYLQHVHWRKGVCVAVYSRSVYRRNMLVMAYWKGYVTLQRCTQMLMLGAYVYMVCEYV